MDKKELVFNIYKDKVIVSKKFKDEMKEKYGFDAREADDIFVKITNYQIKKYGGRLEKNSNNNNFDYQTKLTNAIKHYKKHSI